MCTAVHTILAFPKSAWTRRTSSSWGVSGRGAVAGHPAHIDNEYRRLGTANLFLFCEPLRGWRQVKVTERRTKADWAVAIRVSWSTSSIPEAERIVLVMDNLNTHTPASLYEAFEPGRSQAPSGQARHPSPKHGSWLNIAEIELSVLARQCLDRPDPRQPRDAHPRGRGLAGRPERQPAWRRLALLHRRRSRQAQAPLPIATNVTVY